MQIIQYQLNLGIICKTKTTANHILIVFYFSNRGCYSKSSVTLTNAQKASSKSMTLAFCVKVCMSLDTTTKFSGVEGENCFCFDSLINSDPLTNKHCHTKCPGDKAVLCGGPGAMSVTNLVENSIHEVLVLYGGYNNPKFEVINKKGDVCTADTIPGICLLC